MPEIFHHALPLSSSLRIPWANEACVIPILLRVVDWTTAPFAHLQPLPTDAKPILAWKDKDAALADVAAGLRRVIVEELPFFPASAPRANLPAIWTIPYPRNPFFLGRDAELLQIRHNLHTGQATALSQPQAISGLGGIGKTQLALEYAYRYHQDYTAVLWARAESTESLISSSVTLATQLSLPEREAKEQEVTVQAVKSWLQTHRAWLLILDNADDLALLPAFLPPALAGHLLLTTRAAATGRLAHCLEIETLPQDLGALFLLRRAALLAPDAELAHASQEEQELAKQISRALGGLPLALDQAGAYLEETGCSLADYWQIYQQHQVGLLAERRGVVADHPDSVATTWSLSFQRVGEKKPAATDLLRLCAFLAPDAIPEEILTTGAFALGPVLGPVAADPFQFNQALEALRAYSLIRRNPTEKTLSIHRLVQVVLQNTLEEAELLIWVERVIRAVNATFSSIGSGTCLQCERLLTHALLAAHYINTYQFLHPEARGLLSQTAFYLKERARYREAEALYQQALRLCGQSLGSDHSETALLLNEWADLCLQQGKYRESELLFQRAIDIVERNFGGDHIAMAAPLNGLAVLYNRQGRYAEAESLYRRALCIWEQSHGPEHPQIASPLNGLANLHYEQGQYAEAEPLFQRTLVILKQHLGPEHRHVADSLNGLAHVYYEQGRYAEAEPLFQQAISIWERSLGHEHPVVAIPLRGLAHLYRELGKHAEAEPLYQRALQIREQSLGDKHPSVAHSLRGLAHLYYELGRYTQAEPLYQRALYILEQSLGDRHPSIAYVLNGLAVLYKAQRKYAEAEPLFQRELHIWEQSHGHEHPLVSSPLRGLAYLYCEQGQYAHAEPLYQRALRIRERAWGPEHPETAKIMQDLAQVYEAQNRREEAGAWYARALTVRKQALGAHHPKTTETRTRLIALLHAMEDHEETAHLERDQTEP